MTNSLTLIDTDVLIDVAHKNSNAIERLEIEAKSSGLAISSITQMELIVGCRNKTELKYLEEFLQNFQNIPLNMEISGKAIALLKEYRLSHGLLIADSLIAATSIIYNYSLLTKNQKHFKYITELELLSYP